MKTNRVNRAYTIPLLFVGLAFATSSLLAQAEQDTKSWTDYAKEFKAAALAKDYGALAQLAGEVGVFDHPKAVELLIKYTLFGEAFEAGAYDLERRSGKILSKMSKAESRAVVYKYLTKFPKYETRIVLAAVAYRYAVDSDPTAIAALGQALQDRKQEVVFAVLRWIRKTGDTAAVDALIGLLAREEKRPWGRLFNDTKRTLEALTDQSFEIAADWRNYWEARKAGVPPPSTRGGRGATKVVRKKFFTVILDSDKLAFVIDVSGSMEKKDPPVPKAEKEEGEKGTTFVKKDKPKPKPVDPDTLPADRQRIYRVKQELCRTIQSLPENVFFVVQAFSHEVKFLDNKTPTMIPATPDNKRRAIAWVKKFEPNGETWTDTAFERLYKEVNDFDTVILLSDGAPRRDQQALPKDEVLRDIRVLNRFRKARIHTIGFEQAGGNLQRFLNELAQQNDGTYTRLE